MSKVKCYSVRLAALTSISEKAYKASGFDGSEAIIPKSAVFGPDCEVQKSDAYWIAAFALKGKSLQYSEKKIEWFEMEFEPKQEEAKAEPEPIDETPVRGYFLRWQEVRIKINAYGKLATRNRQHIYTYEGPAHQAPKGFVPLPDDEFEMAKKKEGEMIEPYTTPDFAAMIQAQRDAEERIAKREQDMTQQREKWEANEAEKEAKVAAFRAKLETITDLEEMLKEWKAAGAPHPAPKQICEAKNASGLGWRPFIESI